jgi:tetratricopeptide (TPR) repeat protein
MVQAHGVVKISLRKIPFYGVVVVDPLGLLPAEAGIEPFLLSINGQSIESQSLSQLRTLLCGPPGTPVTLDILSADLKFRPHYVSLLRAPIDTTVNGNTVSSTLKKSFELLDKVDSGDWPGQYLQLAEQSMNTLFEPLSSTLYKVSTELSQHWLDRYSMVHFFTQMAAATYFDKIYRIKDADFAINSALQFLPDFDCLNFTEYSKLFDFVDLLIETDRLSEAKSLSLKLLSAARNSLVPHKKTIMALRRMIRLSGENIQPFLDEYFERSKYACMPDELHFVADCYLNCGETQKAIDAYIHSIAASSVRNSKLKQLRDFVQPIVHCGYKLASAYELAGNVEEAKASLEDAITTFQNECTATEISVIDQIPGFFPKMRDLQAKLSGDEVKIPAGTTSDTERPFTSQARSIFDTLLSDPDLRCSQAIRDLLSQASKSENAIECENLVWAGLLNVARQFMEEKRFNRAQELLERIWQHLQDSDSALPYLAGCLTELVVFPDQFGCEAEPTWLHLELALENVFAVEEIFDHEKSSLEKKLEILQTEAFRSYSAKAQHLRLWSLIYLRSNDYMRVERILRRALMFAEKAGEIAIRTDLTELTNLIHGDLAVALIGLKQFSEAEQSIESMFLNPTMFASKAYQIAEAYRVAGLSQNAENLLARSLELPGRKSVAAKQDIFSAGGFHIWRLASVSEQHERYLEDAVKQFPVGTVPPLLVCKAADYAESQNRFDFAAKLFQTAARFPNQISPGIEAAYLKGKILLKALSAADRTASCSFDDLVKIINDLADVASLTNRQLAICSYRRAIALCQFHLKKMALLTDSLESLVAGQTDAEQMTSEKSFANRPDRDFQVRTEKYWVEKAVDELRNTQVEKAVAHIAHALDIYKISTAAGGEFKPLLAWKADSVVALLHLKGFTADAEAFLLESTAITTTKYGVGSEQETLTMSELAQFYLNSGDLDKSVLVINEMLRAHADLLMNPDATLGEGVGAMSFSFHQLASQMSARGRVNEAIVLIEKVLDEERKLLPPDHVALINNLLLLGKLRKENNQFELAEVIFQHAFKNVYRKHLLPTFTRYAPDYRGVLEILGTKNARQIINHLLAADVEIPIEKKTIYPDNLKASEEIKEWEALGKTKQAQDRYITAVETVIETQSIDGLTSEALDHLATHYVQNNRLGQASEVYLKLKDMLNTEAPEFSFRKVLCCLSLARCYTRLCMYEEVPDLILQAKEADPEIHLKSRTIETIFSYISVEVEAHLDDYARVDLEIAESLVDEQSGLDITQKRESLECIFHFRVSAGDLSGAASTHAKLEKLLSEEAEKSPIQSGEPGSNSADAKPFAFLDCASLAPDVSTDSDEKNPAYRYQQDLADKISKNWFPPLEKQPTQLHMQFAVAKDGSSLTLKFIRSSNNKYANEAVEEAILSSAPFGELPEVFGEQCLFMLTVNDADYPVGKSGITFESLE